MACDAVKSWGEKAFIWTTRVLSVSGFSRIHPVATDLGSTGEVLDGRDIQDRTILREYRVESVSSRIPPSGPDQLALWEGANDSYPVISNPTGRYSSIWAHQIHSFSPRVARTDLPT